MILMAPKVNASRREIEAEITRLRILYVRADLSGHTGEQDVYGREIDALLASWQQADNNDKAPRQR